MSIIVDDIQLFIQLVNAISVDHMTIYVTLLLVNVSVTVLALVGSVTNVLTENGVFQRVGHVNVMDMHHVVIP